jgi:hypothetical protein
MAAKRGRPSDYKVEFCERANRLAAQGATDREVAEALDVHEATVHRWKHEHPEFRESLKLGKEAADERVVQSLYRRAVGYSFDAVKITQFQGDPVVVPYVEHVPPDTTAAIFWLKNRQGKDWRDKNDVEHGGVVSFELKAPWIEQIAKARGWA